MSEATKKPGPRLLHMTTVPQTLGFLVNQVEHAKRQGFEVQALSSPGEALTDFAKRAHVDVHELPMARRITPFKDLLSLWRLRRILRRLRPDIIHAHTPKGGLLAMIGGWMCGVPIRVYHIHGLPMVTATGLKRVLLRWSEKVSCKLASQVYCVSESVRAVAVAEGLCPAEKIKVLLNGTIDGIDAERTHNPALVDASARQDIRTEHGIPLDAPVLGFVGRIVRDKGMIELTEAWKVLREAFPALHLLIVGPFEPQDPVPADVESLLRSDTRIHLTGGVAMQAVPRYYRAMDLLALPTYREGFNTVLLEAAAMELPVVASRVPGCIDGVVESETGTLVPAYDIAALTDALRVYLGNPELGRRHGQAGRARVLRDFNPNDMSVAICQEYQRLVQNKCNPASPATFYRRRGKRMLDIVLSAAALMLLSPVLLVLAVLVRVLLGGPVIFRQIRSGFKRQAFTILKFRTMTNARDHDGALLPDSQRLTRFGRFLRGSSLDELPELWNVLMGEMSLVGPRPLLPRYDEYYSETEARRFDYLPGLTGWAQINGRNELAWDKRLECDVYYADHCSFGMDIKIMILTIIKVLRRANAQPDPDLTVGFMDEERRPRAAELSGEKT
jgi:lipopolysaccharide/colanic/teichoic acid biosynthesis glycosyltransferase